AGRIDAPDGARPSQLVPPQIAQRRFRADVGDGEAWYRDCVAALAQRRSDRVVVGKAIGKRLEAADFAQRLAPERDRGAEARTCSAERKPDNDARQEMRVDEERAEACPRAGDGNAVVEAGDGADARSFQRSDDAGKIIGLDP